MDTQILERKPNSERIQARQRQNATVRKFDCDSMKTLAKEILIRNGVPAGKSEDVAEVLIAADRMGIESHGIQRIGVYISGLKNGRIRPEAETDVVRETPAAAALDANNGLGQPAAMRAMRLAIEKAKKTGVGIVAVRNSNHFGIGGYYSLMAAKSGFMGMCMTNSEAMVVPTFGKHPMMGTNPIAVSMPAKPVFFHFDIATSVVPAGKIEVFARKEIPLPEGWSVGVDGAVNTDANAFLKIRREKSDGGLLPLGGFGTVNGGHKGYALSMLVELMTGVLSGGVTSNHVRETAGADRCSHVFQAIDYGMFGDRDAIENHLSEYLEEVRNSAKADGYERILTQGESEFAAAKRIAREGAPIQKSTYDELTVISSLCGLNPAHILVEK